MIIFRLFLFVVKLLPLSIGILFFFMICVRKKGIRYIDESSLRKYSINWPNFLLHILIAPTNNKLFSSKLFLYIKN